MNRHMIHSTAIVAESAVIGNNVEIGAYSIVGENTYLGDNSIVGHHSCIASNICIGNNNRIGNYCSIGCCSFISRDEHSKTIQVGNNNLILDFCVITSGTVGEGTIIGNNNKIGSCCYIGHDVLITDNITISHKAILAGFVQVEEHTQIGAGAFVHQKRRIGKICMIGAMAKVVTDIPDFLLADGCPATIKKLNVVGLERNNMKKYIQEISSFYQAFYSSNYISEQLYHTSPITEEIGEFIKRSSCEITRIGEGIKIVDVNT